MNVSSTDEDIVPVQQPSKRFLSDSLLQYFEQIYLISWKRFRELYKNPAEVLKLLVCPILLFVLIVLFYEQFTFLFLLGAVKNGFFELYVINRVED